MHALKFWKKFLMPCGLCTAVPAIRPQSPQEPESCACKKQTKMLRPSELPIYPPAETCSKDIPCLKERPPSILEQKIGAVRRSVQDVSTQWHNVSDNVTSKIDTGIAHSRNLIEYLQEEDNTMPRLGAVAIGGLTGLIFGLRGGLLKRSLYLGTGALTVGAMCYPRQAQNSFQNAKYYANVGYNFIYGVKPGDKDRTMPDIKLQDVSTLKMPTSFSELVEFSVGIGSAIINAFGSLSKEWGSLTEKKGVIQPINKMDSVSKEKAD